MIQGFNKQREYEERRQVETLRCIRYVGYTVMSGIPVKKGTRKPRLESYYPLPLDKTVKEEIKEDEMIATFQTMQSIITNGKLRGYQDNNDNLWNKDKTKIIAHFIDGAIQYIN